MLFRELYLNFSKDNRCQGSVELILIVGGIIVIILLVVALYKSGRFHLGLCRPGSLAAKGGF